MLDRKRQYLRPLRSANWAATSEPIIPVKGTIHELSSYINLSGILRALTISVRTEASVHPLTVPTSNMVNVATVIDRHCRHSGLKRLRDSLTTEDGARNITSLSDNLSRSVERWDMLPEISTFTQ